MDVKNLPKINYQRQLDQVISQIGRGGEAPTLLLHCCCAPCSSYVFEYLSQYFRITALFYNPNISPFEEYRKRADELKRLISEMPLENPVTLIEDEYSPQDFLDIAKGLEDIPEGGERCFRCYRLRLERAAKAARAGNFDYFTTTLSISPHKNAAALNLIAGELSEIYGIKNLPSDFKKKEGYKRSIELSAVYGLYRQNYCGCVFSKKAAVGASDK